MSEWKIALCSLQISPITFISCIVPISCRNMETERGKAGANLAIPGFCVPPCNRRYCTAIQPASNDEDTVGFNKQKSQMEDLALLHHHSCVLRLSKVITPMDNLTNDWIKNLELGRNIEVFDDFFMSPTPIKKVLSKIDKLILNNSKGIFHCEGAEDISYYSFAKKIAKFANYIC